MSRLFISHSSKNDDWAIALKDWLVREGWSGPDDVFLDLDPERGIAAGQRWARAFADAATRCEAVLFLISQDWLASTWCSDEYQLANRFNKKLFALVIDDVALEKLPGGLTANWQVVRLKGEPAERFVAVHPTTNQQMPVHVAMAGLESLKRGLDKAGIGAETFELQPDPRGPFGWRPPYRGLEALEPEDAAVFFGRSADIVRGIDALRGLAARNPPRLLVILGASGAGKSSFLRAGLWPRLLRDDSQWLPLRAIRAGHGGAIEGIEGIEGLLVALEDVHHRFAMQISRADLRDRLASPRSFVDSLQGLRQVAARRALQTEPPYPLPILCLDQGEELFAADAGPESEKLLLLARAAMEADAALLLATIRSDTYGLMQSAPVFAGIEQVPLSLGPVPHGEMGRVIREPAEMLRRKVGPAAPVFDVQVVERLQAEIEGEADSLPLLAFVLQRLMREHAGSPTIGLGELDRTGGVAAAIESEAEAALGDAGFALNRPARREALQRLFIPRLARIDRDSKTVQRRIARQSELPADLRALAHALTERRLLVVKVLPRAEGAAADAATIEVAHEALLRRWPTLVDLLAEDRDALLLLDGVLSAAADWEKADDVRKPDFLAHRGSRLADARRLSSRGSDWAREIAPGRAYLAACQGREDAERAEKEAALGRQLRLQRRVTIVAIAAALLMTVIGGAGVAYAIWNNRTRLQLWSDIYLKHTVLSSSQERALKPGERFHECTRCPEMVVVPAGSFTMGSPATEKDRLEDEGPQHKVTIANAFAVGRFEVTFDDWDACSDAGGCSTVFDWGWGHGTRPAILVSWYTAKQYVAWLSKITGQPYRLLSDAEYEYATRAGTTTIYFWGDEITLNESEMANCLECGSQWDDKTAPVGSFSPNAFGLYDMVGNVWAWTEDCYRGTYDGAPDDGSAWTGGLCIRRVVRGGSFLFLPDNLRSARREAYTPGQLGRDIGFRVARTLIAP